MEKSDYLANPALGEYFATLPPKVQNFIVDSKAEISTLGELMKIGEHFKREL